MNKESFGLLILLFTFVIIQIVSIWAHGIESIAIWTWIGIVGQDLLTAFLIWLITREYTFQ